MSIIGKEYVPLRDKYRELKNAEIERLTKELKATTQEIKKGRKEKK